MKENRRSSKLFDWNRITMHLSRRLNFSFKSLVTVFCLCLFLFPLAIFHLWYPQGVEDLLINSEWRPVPNQPTQQHLVGEQGRRRMRQSTAMIVGVGKDIADHLPSFLRQVEALSTYFNESRAVFVEGDSVDRSREMLQTWAAKSPTNRTVVTVTSSGDKETVGVFQGLKLPREGRLAIARNHVLDALRKLPHMDFVIMVDMDVIGWNVHGIQDSFGRPSWDVICANGIIMHGMYRDTYAFRSKGIDTNHHKGGGDHLLYNISASQRQKNREIVRSAKQRVRTLMDTSTTSNGNVIRPFEVESCFGGMAIYRYDALTNCTYRYREEELPHMLDCEHVLFHQCLRQQSHARIFTNPHMKLWYGHAILEKVRFSDVLPFLFPA